jgi:hypothetical protein
VGEPGPRGACAQRSLRGTGYASGEPAGISGSNISWGWRIVQTAHPRDVAALALVVGVFLVLFIVTLMLGSPTR